MLDDSYGGLSLSVYHRSRQSDGWRNSGQVGEDTGGRRTRDRARRRATKDEMDIGER